MATRSPPLGWEACWWRACTAAIHQPAPESTPGLPEHFKPSTALCILITWFWWSKIIIIYYNTGWWGVGLGEHCWVCVCVCVCVCPCAYVFGIMFSTYSLLSLYCLSLLWGPPWKWDGTSQGAILEIKNKDHPNISTAPLPNSLGHGISTIIRLTKQIAGGIQTRMATQW